MTKRIIFAAGLLLALGGRAAAQGNVDALNLYLGASGSTCKVSNASGTPVLTGCDEVWSGYVGSQTYASQTTGWRATSAGALDVRYLFTDELRAKLVTFDTESVLAGSQRVTKSVSTISQTFTCPAAGSTSTLWVKDSATFGDAAVFVSGDSVVIHSMSRTTFGPFTISDCVGVVTSYADGTGANAGQQSWTFTRGSGGSAGAMSSSTTVAVDQLVQDFGTTGNGYIETTAVDGAAGVNAPYTQCVTWTTAPVAANLVARCRLGNLKGITGTTEYGFLAGSYSGNAFVRFSDVNAEIRGIPLKLYSGSTETVRIDASVPSIALGATLPSAYGTGTGIWMGNDSGTYKFRVGAPGGAGVFWDGSALSINGTSDAGTIGGWNITADALYSNTAGMTSNTTGGDDIRIWAGDTFLSRAIAEFRVFESGVIYATDAHITGEVTATSGAIGGCTLASGTLTCGSSTLDSGGIHATSLSSVSADLGSVTAGQIVVGSSDKLWLNDSADGALAIGGSTKASAPFRVTSAGDVTASTGSVGNCTFSSGVVHCGNVDLTSSGLTLTGFGGLGSANYACINSTGDLYVNSSSCTPVPGLDGLRAEIAELRALVQRLLEAQRQSAGPQ